MRLVNTSTFELLSAEPSAFKSEGYAILSHRWVGLEITYDRLPQYVAELHKNRERPVQPMQLEKIRGACQIARGQGLQWMWIDNCCINKANAVEESESINSMFRWYSDAQVCITYLSDVRVSNSPLSAETFRSAETGKPSVWFTRGWTLQELLAPQNMQFYDMNWQLMGTKQELAPAIEEITGISVKYLTAEEDFREASIAAKMSWMAGRETARVEDIAYSLLGLLDITMTPQYGEGMRAFMRLQQTLLASSMDESLFAWRMPSSGPSTVPPKLGPEFRKGEWGLLADSPEWFRGCGNVTTRGGKHLIRPYGGWGITSQGVVGPMPQGSYSTIGIIAGASLVGVIPYYIWYFINRTRTKKMALNCWEPDEKGRMRAIQLYFRVLFRSPKVFVRTRCAEFGHARKSTTLDDFEPAVVRQP